jgi:hypothetical protein
MDVMKWLFRAVVVLATAILVTILVLGGIALHGVRVFDIQFGARYIILPIYQALPWLAVAEFVAIAAAIYLHRRHVAGHL